MIDWDALLARLPASTRALAAVIGHDRALHLVANLPTITDAKHGARVFVYVPKRGEALSPEHPLVLALTMGFEPDAEAAALAAAQRLSDAFGGEVLNPARCAGPGAMHHGIGEAMAHGVPAGRIAEQLAETEARLMADWVARGSVPADKPRKIACTPRQIRNMGKDFWKKGKILQR